MSQDPTITFSIKEAGERPNSTYLFHILLDGTILTSNQSLSMRASQLSFFQEEFHTLLKRW